MSMRRVVVLLAQVVIWLFYVTECEAQPETTTVSRPKSSVFRVQLPTALSTWIGSDIKHQVLSFRPRTTPVESTLSGQIFYAEYKMDASCHLSLSSIAMIEYQRPTFLLLDYENYPGCAVAPMLTTQYSRGVHTVVLADNVCQCVGDSNDQLPFGYERECIAMAKRPESRLFQRGNGELCDTGFPAIDEVDLHMQTQPTIIIDYVASQKIKDCMQKRPSSPCQRESAVIAAFRWPIRTDPVLLEMVSSPEQDGEFKKAFAALAPKLESRVMFQPRYVMYRIKTCSSNDASNTDGYCSRFCLRNKYCTAGSMAVSGSVVLEEVLRQVCIYRQSAMKSSVAAQWWEYTALYATECGVNKFGEACSRMVQDRVKGLNSTRIARCVRFSWRANGTNSIFENELANQYGYSNLPLPVFNINGITKGESAVSVSSMASDLISSICHNALVTVPICACLTAAYGDSRPCMEASCPTDQRLCLLDNKCYPNDDNFLQNCDPCLPPQQYCPALRTCTRSMACPSCPDKARPYFCSANKQCERSVLDCTISVEPHHGKGQSQGLSGSDVAAIVSLVIVFLVLVVYACWWRRTKTELNSEVRDILEQYRPISGASRSQPRRPLAPLAASGEMSSYELSPT